MATDAQRLIAMSIGKIAASRGQRGGINLHKNLLVASVLHKARTIYMLENYHQMMETRRLQLESSENVMQSTDAKENSCQSLGSSDHEVPCLAGSEAGLERGESQDKPSCMYASRENDNKENAPPQVQQQSVYQSTESDAQQRDLTQISKDNEMVTESCGRCTKRRLSDVDSELDSQVVPCAKKAKLHGHEHSESKTLEVTSREHEQKHTSPTQITHLVQSFSSGFTGLLNEPDDEDETPSECERRTPTSPDHGYSSAEDEDEDDVFSDDPSDCSNSDKTTSLMSCSTQIKEAFETLARPLVLTV